MTVLYEQQTNNRAGAVRVKILHRVDHAEIEIPGQTERIIILGGDSVIVEFEAPSVLAQDIPVRMRVVRE